MENSDLSPEMRDQHDAEGDSNRQGRPARNNKSKSRAYSSIAAQCDEVNHALCQYPLVKNRLYMLDNTTRVTLTNIAWEWVEMSAEPRMAYFMRWMRDTLEDKPLTGTTLIYEDFADLIHVSKMTVTRIRRQMIARYAETVDRVLFWYLLFSACPDFQESL